MMTGGPEKRLVQGCSPYIKGFIEFSCVSFTGDGLAA
ncbi:hypothetical protein L195_g063749, partial [Trifolium pratense]